MVVNQLSDIQVDLCFLGANGISTEAGITDSDIEVVQVKKAMIKSAKRTVIVSIAEKLNSVQKMKVCNFNFIQYLITDLDPADETLKEYAEYVDLL